MERPSAHWDTTPWRYSSYFSLWVCLFWKNHPVIFPLAQILYTCQNRSSNVIQKDSLTTPANTAWLFLQSLGTLPFIPVCVCFVVSKDVRTDWSRVEGSYTQGVLTSPPEIMCHFGEVTYLNLIFLLYKRSTSILKSFLRVKWNKTCKTLGSKQKFQSYLSSSFVSFTMRKLRHSLGEDFLAFYDLGTSLVPTSSD